MMIVKIKIDKTINYGYVGDSIDDDNDNHDDKSTAAWCTRVIILEGPSELTFW